MSSPTFATLKRVLLDLGFRASTLLGSQVMFEHAESDTLVVLRPYRDEEQVDPGNVVGIRRLLDEKGGVGRGQFEELLREQSLAG